MCTVQIEAPDELVQKLAPYRDKLAELLELGLEQYINRERQARLSPRVRASPLRTLLNIPSLSSIVVNAHAA